MAANKAIEIAQPHTTVVESGSLVIIGEKNTVNVNYTKQILDETVSGECFASSWNFIRASAKESCPRGGEGGSSIEKVPVDVPPARVYFFGLLV